MISNYLSKRNVFRKLCAFEGSNSDISKLSNPSAIKAVEKTLTVSFARFLKLGLNPQVLTISLINLKLTTNEAIKSILPFWLTAVEIKTVFAWLNISLLIFFFNVELKILFKVCWSSCFDLWLFNASFSLLEISSFLIKVFATVLYVLYLFYLVYPKQFQY